MSETQTVSAAETVDPLAGLLHELDTPLGVALTALSLHEQCLGALSARLAATGIADPDKLVDSLRESVRLGREGLDRAIAIVNARRETLPSTARLSDELIDMEVLLGDALSVPMARFASEIGECALEVEHALLVRTEPNAWYQVIANLVANSVLHGFAGRDSSGRIVLQAYRLGADRVRVVYRDDGRGFSARARASAFEQHYSSRGRGGSSGLGLCIVRDIVRDRLHGTITLLDAPGGASFEIDIPFRPVTH